MPAALVIMILLLLLSLSSGPFGNSFVDGATLVIITMHVVDACACDCNCDDINCVRHIGYNDRRNDDYDFSDYCDYHLGSD